MSVKRYKKRPNVVEAMQLTENNRDEVIRWCFTGVVWSVEIVDGDLIIGTFEGNYQVDVGDYIVKDEQGEIHPMKRHYFEATHYEVFDEEEQE